MVDQASTSVVVAWKNEPVENIETRVFNNTVTMQVNIVLQKYMNNT